MFVYVQGVYEKQVMLYNLVKTINFHVFILSVILSLIFCLFNKVSFQANTESVTTGLWQMFRTFVLRCDWSILRILKSTKKHERQSGRVTLVSIYNNIFRLYHH